MVSSFLSSEGLLRLGCQGVIWEFPKMRGTFLGSLYSGFQYFGVYIGPLIFGKLPFLKTWAPSRRLISHVSEPRVAGLGVRSREKYAA